MLNLYSRYATDKTKETEGTWIPIGGGAEILVARNTNRNYTKRLAAEYEKHSVDLEVGDEAAEQLSEELMANIIADTILLGWKNIAGADGKPLEYSKEAAVKLLLELPDFTALVLSHSKNIENFRAEQEAREIKN